jgi:inorganic pyrophosphatase
MKFPFAFTGKSEDINVIIETPSRSRNKYAFDPETELYTLTKTLPAGMAFPFEFGFIPGTMAEDGDPLDAMVLMDEPSYPGCLVKCRAIGVIEADQNEDGKIVRNDRVLAVSVESYTFSAFTSVEDLNSKMIEEITSFFVTYHTNDSNEFMPIKTSGPKEAIKLIRSNIK